MIKDYKSFKNKYSIYDFFEYLKSTSWNNKYDIEFIEKWTNHFVGDEYYKKIETHVSNIYNIFKNVDIYYVKDRLLDIFDDYNDSIRKCSFVTLYSDFYETEYNGLIEYANINFIIVHIIKSIIYPTLSEIRRRSENIRKTVDQIYVLDDKYKCKFASNSLVFSRSDKYDVDDIIFKYKPAILISVESDEFQISAIEKDLENILPSILHSFDYEDIIWDMSKGSRKFSDDTKVSEYSLKIILK